MGTPAIEVDNVSMMFNLNKEKIDNLKEYVIKFLTRKLHFTGGSGLACWALTGPARARCLRCSPA